MNIPVIVQARMGSSRLPGKVLIPLGDRPVIQWVVDRASRIPGTNGVVVATSAGSRDDVLAAYCSNHRIELFRGDEMDALDRIRSCALELGADAVVRVTADCPLLDPAESGRVVAAFRGQPACQYASNVDPRSLPDGLDTEVISMAALEASWHEATAQGDREHVTAFVRRQPERFPAASVVSDVDLSHIRLTLDTEDDLAFLSAVVEQLAARGQHGSLQEIIAVLEGMHQPATSPAVSEP